MTSPLVIAAKEIATFLDVTFPEATVERVYLPTYELQELDALRLVVVPMSQQISRVDRSLNGIMHEVRIDVGVIQKPDLTVETVDEVMETVNAVIEAIQKQVFATENWEVAVVRVENAPVLSDEHYRDKSQATSLLSITCKVMHRAA